MSLMNLLRHISLKHLHLQKTQIVMAISGICLGVAAMVAVDLVNRSVLVSFEESINQATGRASLQVTGGESGFPEALLDTVQGLSGVEYAVPVVEATASMAGANERSLMVLGVDILQDHKIRTYSLNDDSAEIPDPLLFLAKADSLLLTRTLAGQLAISIDQSIRLQTVAGLKTFTVRGLLNPEGPARVAGGDIAIMDIYAAQLAFGKAGRLDRIDVSLLPGASLDKVKARIQQALPAGYEVDTPTARSRQVEILLGRFRISMAVIGGMALFVGMYLIYNTVAIAVVQRRREIGILRALGAGRAQIAGLFLTETLICSALASVLGLGLGLLFARASIGVVAQSVTDMYVKASVSELAFSWPAALGNTVIGILASLIAAILPAMAAARTSPVAAIRAQPYAGDGQGPSRRLTLSALLCLLAGVICLAAFETASPPSGLRSLAMVFAAAILMLLGLSLAAPILLARFVPRIHGPLAACCGAQGRIAGINLHKNVSRNGVAVAAILCAIALFVSSANTVASLRTSMFEWFDSIIRADILVSSGHPMAAGGAPTIPMPPEMLKQIAAIPGVRLVEPFRKGRVTYNGRKVLLELFDVKARMEYCPVMIASGNREDMARLLPDQDYVVVNEALAAKEGIKPGDSLVLPTPAGPVRFGVAAVVVSFTSDSGVVWMDINTYRRHWQDFLVDTYEVLIKPGEDLDTVRQAILARFSGERRLFALAAAEFKVEVRKILDRSFAMTNAVTLLTLVIAGLGILVTMLASVLERTREIGILRGIGMTRGQVYKVVLLESALIGLAGGVLGSGAGILIGWIELDSFRLDFGASIIYRIHYPALVWAVGLSIALAALAGLYPARRAASTSIVEALSYE